MKLETRVLIYRCFLHLHSHSLQRNGYYYLLTLATQLEGILSDREMDNRAGNLHCAKTLVC